MMTEDRLEPVSREEYEKEFGKPGVRNPRVVDRIELRDDTVVLSMIETRRWGRQEQLRQLEEKLNRYLGYALDGFLAQHYPQWAGKRVVIRLACVEAPHGEAAELLTAAENAVEQEGLGLEIDVDPSLTD